MAIATVPPMMRLSQFLAPFLIDASQSQYHQIAKAGLVLIA